MKMFPQTAVAMLAAALLLQQGATAADTFTANDGLGSSTVTYSADPMHGPAYQVNTYDNWASAGVTKSDVTYNGGTLIDDYLWLMPGSSSALLTKVHKTTGAMTSYPASDMPAGYAAGPDWPDMDTYSFRGSVYDGTSLWMITGQANMVVSVNPTTGAMKGFTGFGSSAAMTPHKFCGASYDGNGYIWMTPHGADAVTQLATSTGVMKEFKNWPTNSCPTLASYRGRAVNAGLRGGAFDGRYHWMVPDSGPCVIGIDTTSSTGVMKGYPVDGFASSISIGLRNYFFSGIVTDSTSLWLMPGENVGATKSIVHLNTTYGFATGYKSWPSALPADKGVFQTAVFDGQYIWMGGGSYSILIRFDTTSGAMSAITGFPDSFSGGSTPFVGTIFDPTTQSLWFLPYSASSLVKVTTCKINTAQTSSASACSCEVATIATTTGDGVSTGTNECCPATSDSAAETCTAAPDSTFSGNITSGAAPIHGLSTAVVMVTVVFCLLQI